MAFSGSFSALTYRNFRLFWFGQVISLTGTWMHSTAQGWLVLKLTDSPFYLGLVGSLSSLPILLFTLIGGVVADRFPRRNILLTTQVVLLFLAFLLGLLVSSNMVTVWLVACIAFGVGAANAFDIPARQSFLIEMVGRENVMNAIALNSAAFHGSRVLGPAIAGLLIGYLGLSACFYINALSFLAAISALVRMKFSEQGGVRAGHAGMVKEMKKGLAYIRGEPKVYGIIISVSVISFFGFPYITFLPVYARDILRTGAEGLGALMSSAGAGAFAGALILAARGNVPFKGHFMALSGIIFSSSLLILSLSSSVRLCYLMLFLMGWSAISQIATANSLIQLVVPDELRGRVMSSFTMMFLGMTTLGNFVIGILADYAGTGRAVSIGAVLCLLGTVLLFWKKPDIYRTVDARS